jgi:hypothetical protein
MMTIADILQSTWGAPIIGTVCAVLIVWMLLTDPFA